VAVPGNPRRGDQRDGRSLYKRAWDERVAPRYRAGEPAPGMSREQFLRLLAAAEHLAAHIHEAPVWIVPCLEGEVPMRWSGSSIYPAVQNVLLAARAVGLGATLTTLYLQFEKEAETALGPPPGVHSYAFCRSATPRAGSGRCAVSRSPMSFSKIGGSALPRSVVCLCRNCRRLGLPPLLFRLG